MAFGALLKTDDDSMVHVGRATAFLFAHSWRNVPDLYAGRVFDDSQVIRANFTRRHLFHPEWYPADFVKVGRLAEGRNEKGHPRASIDVYTSLALTCTQPAARLVLVGF